MFVITKNTDAYILDDIIQALEDNFEDFDYRKQLKDIGISFSDDKATYQSDCKDILERLRNEIKEHAKDYKDELDNLEAKMKASKNCSEHEYKQIYGTYWLLTDSMQAMSKGSECQV